MLTLGSPKRTVWRIPLTQDPVGTAAGEPIALITGRGFAPRFGVGYLLDVSSREGEDSLWKLADGAATEFWSAPDSRIVGGPEVDADSRHIAFTVGRTARRPCT